jgi:uncharacterized protein YegL
LAPLSPLEQVALPNFEANGGTDLGRALNLLNNCIRRENLAFDQWARPIIILVTDGDAGNDWEHEATKLRTAAGKIFVILFGGFRDYTQLDFIATHQAEIICPSQQKLRGLSRWLAAIINEVQQNGSELSPMRIY